MAVDGTLANPRQILTASIEPVGFYFTGIDGTTGQPLTAFQIQSLLPFVAILPKSNPQVDPAAGDWVAATWHLGAKGLRADIEWGSDFVPTRGVTYAAFGMVQGNPDQPQNPFAYFKAI